MFPEAYGAFATAAEAAPCRLGLLLSLASLLAGGCASTGAVPRPFPGAGAPPLVWSSGLGAAVAETALRFTGVPYRNGGSDPSGFDCSGLVWYAFAQHGLDVPRTVTALYDAGTIVDPERLGPGDLVFFEVSGTGPSHVGIVVAEGHFVHAPSSNGQVRVERMGADYWRRRFVGGRRLTPSR